MTDATATRQIKIAKTYFCEIDKGACPAELFAPQFEFFFPKFGVGRGLDEFYELATGMASAGLKVAHHHDQLTYIECGPRVIVEGTTSGSDAAGGSWNGGETPGGRFCSTFDFNADGLIERMYVYLDPDYTSLDKDRFRWDRAAPSW